ncbi:MAG: hypothetical protein Q4A18_01485 [Rikenellaceae bacterium]|nr:hypothetical protein [Rikenellaceae bacterium]
MQRALRIVLVTLLWALVVGYVLYAADLVRRHRAQRTITTLTIEVQDSSASGSLITSREVRERIRRSGIKVLGERADSVDLSAIESLIARNGFVAEVEAFCTEDTLLRITLSQRLPQLRLLTNGMNSYVTREGYLFVAPPRSSRYVPVVTGSYQPPVPKDYTGLMADYVEQQREVMDTTIRALERKKYPHFLAVRQNNRRLDSVRRIRIKPYGFLFFGRESEESFDRRVKETRAHKAALRRHFRYIGRQIQAKIDRLSEEQAALRLRQKKLEKNYEDFLKLLTFVEIIENDAFWRSELVEIIAETTPGGALELSFIPRSGSFKIRFGRIEEADETRYKLEKLARFYEKGLPTLGWERYREIDLRYADRVVCR